MRRRFLYSLAVAAAALAILAGLLPYWLPWILAPVGDRYGLTFGRYERMGYARFALHHAALVRGRVRVTAIRAEADTPLLWLWRHTWDRPTLVTVGAWSVEVMPAPSATIPAATTPTATAGGWQPLHRTLRRIANGLARWLPAAEIGPGGVLWPGGRVDLAAANWSSRTLNVEQLVFRALRIDGRLVAPADGDLLDLTVRSLDRSQFARLESKGDAVTGEVGLWEQRAAVQAQFGDTGWWPESATVRADAWQIPGERIKVGAFYSSVNGRAVLDWQKDRFTVDVSFEGTPLVDRAQVPPLSVRLMGRGDLQSATVETLDLRLPGVTAALSDPVTIMRDGTFRESAARFNVAANLSEQPWLSATGTVRGEARLVSPGTGNPIVEFQWDARDVVSQGVTLAAATARGRFEWPRITVDAGTLTGGENERFEWRGGWDFRTKSVLDLNLEGRITRNSLERWMPAQPGFESIAIRAAASGELASLQHSGTASAERVTVPGLKPLAATVTWNGRGGVLEHIELTATAGSTQVVVAGSGDRQGARIERLELQQGGSARLQLQAPTSIRWRPELEVEIFHLTGPEGGIDGALTWGDTGKIELAVREVSSKWFDELVVGRGFDWRLKLLALTGSWDRGPLTFSLSGGAEVGLGEKHTIAVMAAMRGSGTGLTIEALRAAEGDTTVFNATGQFPAVVMPRGNPLVTIDPKGAVGLVATAAPNALFWEQLAATTGVEFKEPQASAELSGTWGAPLGSFILKAERIAMDPVRFKRPLPTLEGLDVQLTGDRAGIQLERLSVRAEGQTVRARGRLPVVDGRWAELIKAPWSAARSGADLHLEIPSAEVAAFARLLPATIAPIGRLEVDLKYQNGAFAGYLRLREAASRPLGPLGVLQEVSADLVMTGRTLELREVTAKSGGQPVTLTGAIELPANGGLRYDLTLRGENLPFVRQAGLLLRGDLDLKLQTRNGGESRLTGAVRLRDSLFLSEIRSLVPTGGASGPRRPPYFSINTPPINAWVLAVDVSGSRFLRMRTPVFTGLASAHFRLTGTLGEPRAIGEATLDEGLVLMPFASFELKQGAVRLTESDPFEPTIFVRGTGRRFGYNLTLEVEGAASSPNVILSSSPALESEQVLLMVMTGAPPTDEINYSAVQRVTRIGTFLGQSLLGSFGADAANADRLSIASGEKISRQGKETYEIEYKLSDRLSVVGEYNEFDEQNAGLKWRIFPRKRAAEEANDEKK